MKTVLKTLSVVTAALLGAAMTTNVSAQSGAAEITVTPSETIREISPYIFGVNSDMSLDNVSPKSLRLGGNRLTAYNWENNVSNAGSDWKQSSDMYLADKIPDEYKNVPAGVMLSAAADAKNAGIPYTLVTLQMAGYVSSAKKGEVPEDAAAPSEYWYEVKSSGGASSQPDTSDNVVYMDGLLSRLTETLGKSDTENGIKAYALDNEPALWSHTHPRVHGKPVTCAELIDKSKELASVVKDIDSGAMVFGPALYGYAAYDSLQGASDWKTYKSANGYRWFIDLYLDEMRKAEDEGGRRILDVLDIHYYTEAKGACGERSCGHYDNDDCVAARLNSVRSLYEEGYRENSWIIYTGAKFFPLLPNIEQSIEKYYPGTKLAITEYDFGGGDHISGGVCEADTLGIFAEHGVYFASLWSFDKNAFQYGAINMFTNYDGNGSSFGDTLVKSEHSGGDVGVYSSVSGDGTVTIMVTNHSIHDDTPVNIKLADGVYSSAEVYSLYGDRSSIRRLDDVSAITDNSFSYTLPALSVTEFVVKTNAAQSNESAAASGSTANGSSSESTSGSASGKFPVVPIAAAAGSGLLVAAITAAIVIKRKK